MITSIFRWSLLLCNPDSKFDVFTDTLCPCESGWRLYTFSEVCLHQSSGCPVRSRASMFHSKFGLLAFSSRGFSNSPTFLFDRRRTETQAYWSSDKRQGHRCSSALESPSDIFFKKACPLSCLPIDWILLASWSALFPGDISCYSLESGTRHGDSLRLHMH